MFINFLLLFSFHSDYLFKLLLIGDSGVGKSCLLLRFAVSELIVICEDVALLMLIIYLFLG